MANTARAIFKASTGAAVRSIGRLRKSMDEVGESALNADSTLSEVADHNLARFGQLAAGALGVATAIAGMGVAAVEVAKKSQATTAIMGNLTISIREAAEAAGGMVSNLELATTANRLTQTGVVKTGAEYAKLTKATLKLAAAQGIDATDAMDRMGVALARGSAQRLDDFGILIDQEAAEAEYAAAIGKTTDALTDNEKKLATRAAAMEQIFEKAEALNEAETGLAAAILIAKTDLENFKDELLDTRSGFEKAEDALSQLSDEWYLNNAAMIANEDRAVGLKLKLLDMGVPLKDMPDLLDLQAIALGKVELAYKRWGDEIASVKDELTDLEAVNRDLEFMKQMASEAGVLTKDGKVKGQPKSGGGRGRGRRGMSTGDTADAGIAALAAQERELLQISLDAEAAFIDGRLELEAEKALQAEEARKRRLEEFDEWVDQFDAMQAEKAKKRAEEEARMLAERTAAYEGWSRGAVDATMLVAGAAIAAADSGEKAVAREIANQAKGAAIGFGLEALKHSLLAAVNAAAWNFPKAAAHGTAAAQAGAGAAVMGGIAGSFGAIAGSAQSALGGGGGGGGSGRYATGGGGVGAAGGQQAPPGPVSPFGGSTPVPGSSEGAGPTIIVQGDVVTEGGLMKAMRKAQDQGWSS